MPDDIHHSTSPPGHSPARPHDPGVSRRSFMKTMGASAAGSAAASAIAGVHHDLMEEQAHSIDNVPKIGPDLATMSLRINGRDFNSELDPATTLLDALRWSFSMTGTKEVCDRGACGGCSVLVDGKLAASCMMLAVDAEGAEITTIEGLANGDELDPVQDAFIKHDALQCGFCTPGLIMASRALLNENPKPTMGEIRQGLSGNLCRCGTYTNIFNAVLEASGQPVPVDSTDGKGGGR